MDYQLLLFLGFVSVAILIALFFPTKCPKCQSKLKVELIADTWGINITKNFMITPKKYGGFDSYYSCVKCKQLYLQKKNSSLLEEINTLPDRFVAFK